VEGFLLLGLIGIGAGFADAFHVLATMIAKLHWRSAPICLWIAKAAIYAASRHRKVPCRRRAASQPRGIQSSGIKRGWQYIYRRWRPS